MNMEKGYVSSALIRPVIENAGNRTFEELSETNELVQRVTKLLKDLDGRVPVEDADDLISLLIRETGNEALCVHPPSKFNTQGSCQLNHLFLCSNTLREALYYMEKFSPLLSDMLEVNVTRTREGTIKVKLPVFENAFMASQRHRTELIISTILTWIRQLCGTRQIVQGINLPYPATQYQDQQGAIWNTPTTFNSGECAILLAPSALDEGVHNTNPHILNMIKRDVEEQYRKLARSGSLADRIRKALLQEKVRLNANQQEVASYFHISARTLNRHLHREDTSLKQIVTQVRLEMAKRMLTDSDDPIEQIALNIGLSGRRTLDRIFIKEVNLSPAQYRQKFRHQAAVAF
ncbi:AraC family transcriptional regulator ligand-binding domain-containing protein [Thalassolituus sp.]|uniref:AraC family transcriptional regulator ligand-binding domain-containing protein n=1 Tax=Thalassolituus sp. TaxID=2030822 RepID=UPI0035111751